MNMSMGMGMGMGLYLLESQSQKMALVGGATLSIFPQAESWLLSNADNYEALEFVACRKNMKKYHSMIDFIFCELFVKYRKDCFRYYEKKGLLLKEIISREEIEWYDAVLLGALKLAHQIFREQRKTNWASFRQEVLGFAA